MGGFANILLASKPSVEVPATVTDADAQAYVNAAVISNTTIANAFDTLVIGLKADSLWTKFYALYLPVNSNATKNKWNLKNPLDTDAAFRLVFSGTITHNANGVTGDGSTGYADTKFNDTTVGVSTSNFSMGCYCRTNNTGTSYNDMGAVSAGGTYNSIRVRYDSSTDFAGLYDDSNGYGNDLTTSLGLLTINRTSSTEQKFYQNGTLKRTRTGFTSTALTNLNHYLMCRNLSGSAATFSNRNYSLFFFATSFDATQMTNLNSRVQTFMTTLGLNV